MAINASIHELDLLRVIAGGVVLYEDSGTLDHRRSSELVITKSLWYNASSGFGPFETEAFFDHKYATQESALMGILLTIFIIAVFTVCLLSEMSFTFLCISYIIPVISSEYWFSPLTSIAS